jgi:hypothetical protein
MDGVSSMLILLFLSQIILYGTIVTLIGEQGRIRTRMDEFDEYIQTNERQIANLISDIVKNDGALHEAINKLYSKVI